MYTIDKLQKLNDYLDNGSNESILSKYLLKHLNDIENISLQDCIKDTGVSKSSIHRFFNSGGYDSFKELVQTIKKEMDEEYDGDSSYLNIQFFIDNSFDYEEVIYLSRLIKKADRVYFYGNQKEIDKLQYLTRYLRNKGKLYSCLNVWNINKTLEKINQLNNNDLLIIVDTSLKIQELYEFSINYKNIVSIDDIMNYEFHKIYIGDANKKTFGTFKNIKIKKNDILGIEKLDLFLYKQLRKGE